MGISVKSIENGDKRIVTEAYTYPDGVTIPKGYIFDGASVPRIFWGIVAPFKHVTCSARHDWDCGKAKAAMEKGHKKTAKKMRKKADTRYRRCKSARDNKFAGGLAWAGVRIGSFFGSGW